MKFSSLISSLRNSTKATMIACSVFLAFTALVLFFLMLFPIQIKERSATLSAPVLETTVATTTTHKVIQVQDTGTEPPHTLSTWKASIQTLEGTTDPNEIPWYDKLFTTSETSTNMNDDDEDEPETVMSTVPANLSITELITQPAVQQTVTQTVPVPVLTEPPATMPPDDEAEIVPAQPDAPMIS